MRLLVILGAPPAFDPVDEVGDFLSTMISTGWPIFLAIAVGLIAVTLARGAIVAVFRKVSGLFTRGV